MTAAQLSTLKPPAAAALRILYVYGPLVRNDINPGIVSRLLIEDLIELIWMPSPFKKNLGDSIQFAKITAAGRQRIVEIDAR